MKNILYFIMLSFLIVGCTNTASLTKPFFPDNPIVEDLSRYLVGYCWQMPNGRESKNNPDDSEVAIVIGEVSGEQRILIRDEYNFPPHRLSDYYIYKAGCPRYGDDVRYVGNVISLDPIRKNMSYISGSDPNLTRFEFIEVDLNDNTYEEMNFSNISEHNDYFFNPKQVVYSPDGSKVAVLGMDTSGGSGNIWVYDGDSDKFIRITKFSGVNTLAANVSWSKDGNRLAIGLGEISGVGIADLADMNKISYREISHNTNPEIIGEWPYIFNNLYQLFFEQQEIKFNKHVFSNSVPVWINNDRIIFTAADKTGVSTLYSLNVLETTTKNIVENIDGNMFMPTLSPDGSALGFVRYSTWKERKEVEVMVLDISANYLTPLVSLDSKSSSSILISGMMWSPDSKYLVFSSNHDEESDIYIISSDGSGSLNVTKSIKGNAVSPFWMSR